MQRYERRRIRDAQVEVAHLGIVLSVITAGTGSTGRSSAAEGGGGGKGLDSGEARTSIESGGGCRGSHRRSPPEWRRRGKQGQ